MEVALLVRRDPHPDHWDMVLVHDGALADANKVMVPAQRLVHRAGGGHHGEPDLERRPFQGRHA